jgi:hypothetical protein
MAQFSTSQIAGGNRVLVTGEDSLGVKGQTVVDSTEWNDVKAHQAYHLAEKDYDVAVEEFFAPLMAAAEAMGKACERPERDSINYIVYQDEVEGVKPEPARIQKLSHDSVILRVIEQGDFGRLVWVNDTLEVLEVAVNVAPSVPTAAEVTELGAEAIGKPEL